MLTLLKIFMASQVIQEMCSANIHLHMHMHQQQTKSRYIYKTTYIKYLRAFLGAHASMQTEVDKCVKCLGPSHEWSNRSISCMMAVRFRPDGLSLSDFTLFSCLSVVPAGDMQSSGRGCGVLFVRLHFWILWNPFGFSRECECLFLQCFMHYSWCTQPFLQKHMFLSIQQGSMNIEHKLYTPEVWSVFLSFCWCDSNTRERLWWWFNVGKVGNDCRKWHWLYSIFD